MEKDAHQIASVSQPTSSDFEGLPEVAHTELVENLNLQWHTLLSDRLLAKRFLNSETATGLHEIEFIRVLNIRLGTWFAASVTAALGSGMRNSAALKLVAEPQDAEFVLAPDDAPVWAYLATARVVANDFRMFALATQLMSLQRTFLPAFESLREFCEHSLHEALGDLWGMLHHPLGEAPLTSSLLNECMQALAWMYPPPAEDDVDLAGPFSSIRLPELDKLARRDEQVLKRYGSGAAAKVFEQQLALIFQSFGTFVIQTRPGERTVDLLCITADHSTPFTFLVEAKSSKRPYGLPTSDERAMREYTGESRRLTTLPPLRLVLVVASAPAKTLEARLHRVEAEEGIIVRFIPASVLADLRDQMSGPLLFDEFYRELVSETTIVPTEFVSRLRDKRAEQQNAHEALVRAMLSLGR